MEQDTNSIGLLIFLVVLAISFGINLLWQALLLRVWGAQFLKQAHSSSAWYFKTKEGEFRVDSTHKKFNVKAAKAHQWQSIDFDQIRQIYIFRSTDTASLIEFFLGGWNLFDLAGRYRDLLHTYSIRLWTVDGEDIPLMTLKQYQQRDWFLGQIMVRFTIAVLTRLRLYRDGEDVAYDSLYLFKEKLNGLGLTVVER